MRGALLVPLTLVFFWIPAAPPRAMPQAPTASSPQVPVFVAYYWRAKPGQEAAYGEHIRTIAEKIDEDARQAGVFDGPRRPGASGAGAA